MKEARPAGRHPRARRPLPAGGCRRWRGARTARSRACSTGSRTGRPRSAPRARLAAALATEDQARVLAELARLQALHGELAALYGRLLTLSREDPGQPTAAAP